LGCVERGNEEAAKEIRALKLGLEARIQERLPTDHHIMPWLGRHAGWLLTRFTVHQSSGRTSYELLRGRPYRGEICEIGESVWARRPGEPPRTGKIEGRWYSGVWIGKTESSDEHLIADVEGTNRYRTARRRPEKERWNVEAIHTFSGQPWDLKLKPARGPMPLLDQPRVEPSQRNEAAPDDPVTLAMQAAGMRPRGTYITTALTDKYGTTAGCPRCEGKEGAHSAECRRRIEELQLKEQVAAATPLVVPVQAGSSAAGPAVSPAAQAPGSGDVVMEAPSSAAAGAASRPSGDGGADSMMVQAAEGQDRGDAKRARTIGGLEVNVLEVQYEYAGLDGQPLPPETIEVMAVDVPGYDTDVVPEAAVYDARTGASLPLHLVRAGRTKEVESMGRHDVYEEKPEAQCQGRRVRAKWLDDKRTDPVTGEEIVRSRCVATEVNTYVREDVNASTPPLIAARFIVSLAASKAGRNIFVALAMAVGARFVAVYDASAAFYHALIDELITIVPPRGLRKPGMMWQLRRALYGTRRAAQLDSSRVCSRRRCGRASWSSQGRTTTRGPTSPSSSTEMTL